MKLMKVRDLETVRSNIEDFQKLKASSNNYAFASEKFFLYNFYRQILLTILDSDECSYELAEFIKESFKIEE